VLTTDDHDHRRPADLPGARPTASALRVAVALGDAGRELALLVALGEGGDLVVAERCLSAEQLLACARAGRVDALLVALDLHRLNGAVLDELGHRGLPLVLLGPEDADGAHHAAAVLPPSAEAADVRGALLAAARGERLWRPSPPAEEQPEPPTTAAREETTALAVLALASGHGAPGRTTVALNLAAALGTVSPTVLVDADLGGPSVAAHLDLDPTRNLYMIAHAEPETTRDWERVVAQEVQPLHARSPQAAVLAGVPKPEMRASLSRRFLERLVGYLRRRYRYVVLDLGADLLGAETGLHRSALGLADQVLLVAAGDVVGLWHARSALGLLRGQLGLAPERIALIVNRHDARFHHGRAEIEWALGTPSAALIPYDHTGAERAIAEHRPMVLDQGSKAGFYLLDLAGRVHGGRIEPPPEPRRARRGWRIGLPWSGRRRAPAVAPAVRGRQRYGDNTGA
jgi:MinD-like ATPase involved in chromosome partitioning or flagellar assembly